MSTIVVGYVPTDPGQAALEHSVAEAKLRGAKLVVVHSRKGGASLDQSSSAKLEAAIEEAKTMLENSGVEFEMRALVRGNEPDEDLVEIADETQAVLIIIGMRRRSPVGKLIMGSVAQRILLDAKCPVMAVKGALGS